MKKMPILTGTLALVLILTQLSAWQIGPMGPGGETICDDGQDNDGDTLIDCADPNCHGETGPEGVPCVYGGESACADGLDNDDDSRTDCDDPGCHNQLGPEGSYCVYNNTAPTLNEIQLSSSVVYDGNTMTVTATSYSDPDFQYGQWYYLVCSHFQNPTITNYNFCKSAFMNLSCTGEASGSVGNRTLYCRIFDGINYSNQATANYELVVPRDLYIEWIKPIQVVEEVPLVAGKATVIRVKVVNNGPEVTTSIDLNVGNCQLEPIQATIRANSSEIVNFYPPNNCIQ